MVDNHNKHTPSFRDVYALDSSAASAEPEPNSIEKLMLVQELKLL